MVWGFFVILVWLDHFSIIGIYNIINIFQVLILVKLKGTECKFVYNKFVLGTITLIEIVSIKTIDDDYLILLIII